MYTSATKRSCCTYDPCGLLNLGNGGSTELSYVQTLQRHFANSYGWKPRFIIDTGRNGAASARTTCKSWCNPRLAGAGHVPTLNTGLPEIVDAFWYLKTPGESDGCTRLLPGGFRCARFDPDCEGPDSIGSRADEPRAPDAGMWFAYQARLLARHAKLSMDAPGALDSNWAGTPGAPILASKSPPAEPHAPPSPPPPPSPRAIAPPPPSPQPPMPSPPRTTPSVSSVKSHESLVDWSIGANAFPPPRPPPLLPSISPPPTLETGAAWVGFVAMFTMLMALAGAAIAIALPRLRPDLAIAAGLLPPPVVTAADDAPAPSPSRRVRKPSHKAKAKARTAASTEEAAGLCAVSIDDEGTSPPVEAAPPVPGNGRGSGEAGRAAGRAQAGEVPKVAKPAVTPARESARGHARARAEQHEPKAAAKQQPRAAAKEQPRAAPVRPHASAGAVKKPPSYAPKRNLVMD